MMSRIEKFPFAFWLFALGFFACTWDLFLIKKLGGFTLKLYQPAFLLALLWLLWEKRRNGLEAFLKPLSHPFALCMLLLALYNIGLAPWSAFPLKSFLYGCWLAFDLAAIWLSTQHLASTRPRLHFLWVIWCTMVFLSAIVIVDQVAYQFGYTGGFLGGNQDIILHWGVSRPHAFASEPSYLASFFGLGLLTTAPQLFQLYKRTFFFWASLLLILYADLATTSRTGLLCLGLGAGCMVLLPLLAGRKVRWRLLAGALGLLLAMFTIFYFATPRPQREAMERSLVTTIMLGRDGSGNTRIKAHLLAAQMAQETHWLGTGMGASYRYFIAHGGVDNSVAPGFTEQHYSNEVIMSIWGQLLAEGGPIAMALFGFAGFFLVRGLFRRWKRHNDSYSLGSLAAAIVLFAFIAFLIGNVCRGDVWVWYALWAAFALPA